VLAAYLVFQVVTQRMQSEAKTIPIDPVDAYDAFAPFYSSYSTGKSDYLRKIEDIVIAHANPARALLDVGSGDGRRALRIAESLNVGRAVLLEPSPAMRAQCPKAAEFWKCRASDLPDATCRFDVITCLWNVLGHLENAEERGRVLSTLRMLLAPGGSIFLDVVHRYNAAAYGWTKTLLRMAYDTLLPSERNGDVTVSWRAGNRQLFTHGHVFTKRELHHLFRRAQLRAGAEWIIDYQTGLERHSIFSGNLLYQLEAM
jgi:SAM-dependent methyltransferase